MAAKKTDAITRADLRDKLLKIGIELCGGYNDPSNRTPHESVDLALKIFSIVGED